jgi:hypothetical protein
MRSLLIRTLLVLTVAGFAAPAALADDPPITVPTPTVPAPDPAPPPSQKPPAKPPPKQHSSPPVPRRSSPTPTPSPQPTFTPPAATRRVTPVHRTTPKTRVKHTKKVVKHKVKAAQRTVKPAATPKKQPAAPAPRPQRREATSRGGPAAGSDWLKWTLVLALATGLMAASVVGLIGTARSPAGTRTRRRRPPIRDVVAEPVGVAFPPAPTPIPPRTAAPPPVAAPTPAPEPPPARVAPEVPAPAPIPAPAPPATETAIPAAAIAAAAAGAVAAEPAVAPEPEPIEEFCEIRVWRGYAKARFYASLDLAAEDEFAVAESPSFRFRGNGTPDDTEAAHEAHQALVQKLVAKGWEPEESGGVWYSTRFRRPLETSNAP